MRVHHLSCVSSCPLGGALMDGRTRGLQARLANHCLLVESEAGLILVDTGYGLRDVADPRSRLSRAFLALLRPELREEMTAVRQIQRLGYAPADVRHIVLTHLDFDHAGGLDDFPRAVVHMLARERDAASARVTMLDRMRYRPQQWSTAPKWRVYRGGEGEPWFGFDCVRQLDGVPADIVIVPLLGHTLGHAGVAVRADGDGADAPRWLLDAGDAYFYRDELAWERPHCTPGLRWYQTLMEKDRRARLWNQQRLRELRHEHADEVTIFSGHDPVEFEHLAGRAMDEPAGASDGGDSQAHATPPDLRGM
jgi:glyoxylase-like metal-dependent hydrolase (beta-lactamase superfamily II)